MIHIIYIVLFMSFEVTVTYKAEIIRTFVFLFPTYQEKNGPAQKMFSFHL